MWNMRHDEKNNVDSAKNTQKKNQSYNDRVTNKNNHTGAQYSVCLSAYQESR